MSYKALCGLLEDVVSTSGGFTKRTFRAGGLRLSFGSRASGLPGFRVEKLLRAAGLIPEVSYTKTQSEKTAKDAGQDAHSSPGGTVEVCAKATEAVCSRAIAQSSMHGDGPNANPKIPVRSTPHFKNPHY